MSYMEQNTAGREAEVGDVGSKLKPLQERGVINVIDIPCTELQTKGLQYCSTLNVKAE